MGMFEKTLFEHPAKKRTKLPNPVDQSVTFDDLLHSKSCCTSGGMTKVRMAMLKEASTIVDRLIDPAIGHQCTNRLIPCTKTFGHRH
jgi:hypothetical protein